MIKLNSTEVDIWFTSDTHGYHKNITRGTTEWNKGGRTRDFDTIEEMTDAIVNGINKYVKQDDILFHLGDWTFGGIDKIWKFRKRIVCKNIYFIAGNHDLKIIEDKVLPNVLCEEFEYQIPESRSYEFHDGEFVGIEEIKESVDYREVYAQEIFNYLGTSGLIQVDKKLVYMSHFPCEDARFDKPSFHIHGHKHGKWNEDNLTKDRLDVGIDSAKMILGEYKPFSWEEVKKVLG